MTTTPPESNPPTYGTPAGAPMTPQDEKLWATLSHAGAIVLGFIAPLVVWLMYKDRSAVVEDQAKESLNFQIVIAIGYVIATVTSPFVIGTILFPVLWVVSLVMCILASLAANRGETYRYPFNWRIVK